MTSQIKKEIMDVLKKHYELRGTEYLTICVNSVNNKTTVLRQVRKLQEEGVVIVLRSRGGRGAKTVYKRNPNQPGQPRRKRGGTR